MTKQNRKLKRCCFGTLAFKQLWRVPKKTTNIASFGEGPKTIATNKAKTRTLINDKGKSNQRHMESSLKRSSANLHVESSKDTTFNQAPEQTMNGNFDSTRVFCGRRLESSLNRFFEDLHSKTSKDTASKQAEKTRNDKVYADSVAAARLFASLLKKSSENHKRICDDDTAFSQPAKKMDDSPLFSARRMESSLNGYSENQHSEIVKDTTSNQAEKTTNDEVYENSVNAARFFASMIKRMGDADTTFSPFCISDKPRWGWICPYSRALIKRLGKNGMSRRVLSPKAATLYRGGMPLEMVVRKVGIKQAFTSWRDNTSIWVAVRVKRGTLSFSIA